MSSSNNNTTYKKTSFLVGNNSEFINEFYADYLEDPKSLPESWRQFFEGLSDEQKLIYNDLKGPSWSPEKKNKRIILNEQNHRTKDKDKSSEINLESAKQATKDSVRAIMLIRAFRIRGHLISSLDPLSLLKKEEHPELRPETYGFTKKDYNRKIFLDGVLGLQHANLSQILKIVKKTYCSNIGYEFMHMGDPDEKTWIRNRVEGPEKEIQFTKNGKKAILNKMIEAEGFEKYLHVKFVGTKRFGLDGGESLVPALEQIIKRGGNLGAKEIKIGMPHRGRLNVLANVMGKPYKAIFSEFFGKSANQEIGGDVKYHLGASSNREFDGNSVHISLTDNPSHLEAVNPVVLGQVRAKQFFHRDTKRQKVIPVLIHGDAAFAGQGIVAECFAMSGLPGHNIGGTIHIIVNNQIGFTTAPRFARSSPYPSDVAKIAQAPIFHVNGDDPEAVVHCAKIATEYRQKFNRDVVIDMVCYRRFGHNEGDEPSFTQPIMYKKIKTHPTTLKIYGNRLCEEGLTSLNEIEDQKIKFKKFLETQLELSKTYKSELTWFEGAWSRFKPGLGKDKRGKSGVDKDKLIEIGKKISTVPNNLNAHKTIKKIFDLKYQMFEKNNPIDWSTAENLAIGSLLTEGFSVRLSGQDSGRGTFSQRHAVLRNQNNHDRYIPLNNIKINQKKFEIIDSLLSELAVLGFEFGYSLSEPETLVIWEAQFGDFANGAQVIIDQFIASGESKWGRASGLVMLLPHGYEGQGPDHSSARLERFLQLCAGENMQVVNCTTPSNYFHALRRQMHRDFRKPLIVMTPKSLLRHKSCISSLSEFTKKNTFHRVLDDDAYSKNSGLIKLKGDKEIKKIVMCSGKIYYDLVEARENTKNNEVVFIRIEQLYPFPAKTLANLLKKYEKAEFIWCQEEPKNMGAWNTVRNYIDRTLEIIYFNRDKVKYVGRKASSSTATGNLNKHLAQQKEILEKVLRR